MSLTEYQKQIDDILQGYAKPYWQPLSQLARLSEEVGEVARVLNHKYGDKPKKLNEAPDDLSDEIGDVLWSLICLANSEGVDLDSTIQRSIEKLTVRDKDRFERKVA
ncbi:nucleotide pyrophosphohydrolase [Aeromicrobium sp.]|nr:nucleotide pyrophosphohydrolase [Candidatus Saccharibacteria bacterium]